MHAGAPWVVTFDEHEVDDDWAGEIPRDPGKQSHDALRVRLTAAFQAYHEHMPVRAPAIPRGPHTQMWGGTGRTGRGTAPGCTAPPRPRAVVRPSGRARTRGRNRRRRAPRPAPGRACPRTA
ncbi:alkaline phosphatase D family protein [Streptomyces sp. NPDC014846]|uniref:alkaline phosphatase D family protein n=1 Tax=Streptomyces sp. NPDC014846 TaxID=3364922 RepID=UPI0037025DB9